MGEPRTLAHRYRLAERTGEPATWLAHDHEADRTVVLTRVAAGDVTARLAATVRTLTGLTAPTLLPPIDLLHDDGTWVVRDHVDAVPLPEHPCADERELARIGAAAAGALVAAHGAGIVHGDVRAEHVLVRPDGSALLAGFATAPPDLAPDAAHPAPELTSGRPAGPAADVYALGTALAEELARTGLTASDRLAATLHTMRAEFPDARPTAWAAQRRLAAIADPESPPRGSRTSHGTTVASAPDNTVAIDSPAIGPAAGTANLIDARPGRAQEEQGVRQQGSGGSDPRMAGPGHQPSWIAAPPTGPAPAGLGRPVPGEPPRKRSKAWLVALLATIAAITVVTGAVLVAKPVVTIAGTAAAPPGTTPPPPSLLGEVSTADPCSFVDADALARLGRTTLLDDLGSPASCTVGIERDTDRGFVTATIAAKKLMPPAGRPTPTGELIVYRATEYHRSCERTIVLPDEHRIEIYSGAGTNDTSFPVCDAAEAATEDALEVLTSGAVRHRELGPPRTSLLSVRACDVIDPAALSSVPSLRDLRERGYNDWSCRYGADPAFPTGARVLVNFTRYSNLEGGNGLFTLDGRSANTFPSATGSPVCEAAVAQRSFTSASGMQRLEVLSVQVALATDQPGASPAMACQKATDLVRSAIPRLPPVR
ncbi:hypothetical protein [Pseudonocardia thermophila]|uniref:hypothetical protein n=1 Tax=Pseudonocardia thermophila TaxID=1848 RepID=UPI00248E947C|nr:hypothetical protein [Pseudonocardia thermophila]